jgi:hypothetical protein
MYAIGLCFKRGGWVFSVYRRRGDVYATLKVRRIKHGRAAATLKVQEGLQGDDGEVFERVQRLGKD